jgi:hypothetical protein
VPTVSFYSHCETNDSQRGAAFLHRLKIRVCRAQTGAPNNKTLLPWGGAPNIGLAIAKFFLELVRIKRLGETAELCSFDHRSRGEF